MNYIAAGRCASLRSVCFNLFQRQGRTETDYVLVSKVQIILIYLRPNIGFDSFPGINQPFGNGYRRVAGSGKG